MKLILKNPTYKHPLNKGNYENVEIVDTEITLSENIVIVNLTMKNSEIDLGYQKIIITQETWKPTLVKTPTSEIIDLETDLPLLQEIASTGVVPAGYEIIDIGYPKRSALSRFISPIELDETRVNPSNYLAKMFVLQLVINGEKIGEQFEFEE